MIPEVSVIIPTYRRPQYIGIAIEGLLAQTLSNWECIIIDDGSDMPELTEICQRYARQDKRIKYIQQKNSGVSVARNRGIAEASADIIVFHDDDDDLHPQRLEKKVEFLRQHPQIAVVECREVEIDDAGKIISRASSKNIFDKPLIQEAAPPQIGILLGHGAFRRDCLVAVGGYNVDFKTVEDLDLTLRITEKYSVALLQEELYFYRRHGNAIDRLSMIPRLWEYSASAYVAAYFRHNNISNMPAICSPELLAYVKLLPKNEIAAIFRRARGGHKRLLRQKRFAEMGNMLGYFNEVFSFSSKYRWKMHRSLLAWVLLYGKFGALPLIIKSMKTKQS